jgi:hypothetical protein
MHQKYQALYALTWHYILVKPSPRLLKYQALNPYGHAATVEDQLGFVFFIGGTVLSGLLNPLFWLLYLVWLVLTIGGLEAVFPQYLLLISLTNLLAGNGAFIFLSMIAPLRRGWLSLIPYSLTAFAYWILISIAAYKALWQLVYSPFYWEKTRHGVSTHAKSATLPAEGVLP